MVRHLGPDWPPASREQGLGGQTGWRDLGAQLVPRRHLGPGLRLGGLCPAQGDHVGGRLSQEEEADGADLSVHRIGTTPDWEVNW